MSSFGDKVDRTCEGLYVSLKSNGIPFQSTGHAPTLPELEEIPSILQRNTMAVVGMSCRFPDSNTPDEFWNMLATGRNPIRAHPHDRPTLKDNVYFEAGYLKCAIDEFDAKFFGLSPREAPLVDPQQRLLLRIIWEGLENAGISPQSLSGSNTAIYTGIWLSDYDHLLSKLEIDNIENHHRFLGNAFSATASRISYFLGLHGAAVALESGCSSSLAGTSMACESLLRGDTDVAITSGVNLVLAARNPICNFNKDSLMLSQDFRCKTFDAGANGFVRAEGCAALVLKRYEDAVRDGDFVHGIIRGSAINNDGAGMSFGTPNPAAQELVFNVALRKAGVRPRDVSYVECHGTGTAVGDPIEVRSISQVYSDGRTSPLHIGSVKSNIGHTEACAGLAGLFKVLLCIKNKAIPPNLHLDTLNPKINFSEIPAVVPLTLTPWNSDCRIAAVSSYSISGNNVHLIIQEPPIIQLISNNASTKDPPSQAILISAKTETALDSLCEIYKDFIEKNPGISLADLAYATNTGRSHFQHRISLIAKSANDVLMNLRNRKYLSAEVELQRNKIGFLFTGQGSQYFGMAESLYQSNSVFQQALDRCNILFQKTGKCLPDVLWKNTKLIEETLFAQPALFCVQYALFKLCSRLGIEPQCVLGHSVGEYAAAVVAGILSLSDAMKLVTTRSRLVCNVAAGSMLAVKASLIKVAGVIKIFTKNNDGTWLDIAAVNSSEEIIVSGNPSSIEKFSTICTNEGLKTQSINATHAFHSRAMDFILKEFGDTAQAVTINKPTCKYISSTLAKTMFQTDFGPGYWQKHLREPVRFSDAVKLLWQECKTLIEIGPQPVLLGLALSNIPDNDQGSFLPSLRRNQEDSVTILNSISTLHIAGETIDWKPWFGRRHFGNSRSS